jgi:hypothetical protein
MSLFAVPVDALPGQWVKLGFSELLIGAVVGCLRQIEAVVRGRPDQHGFEGDGWGAHIEGALAEMAAAKAVNAYWDAPVNTFKDPARGDVGPYEVRRRSRQDYEVLIRRGDADSKVHIAVFGCAPRFRVAGWLFGFEAKQDKWLQGHADRDPAWFMPQGELRGLDMLPRAAEIEEMRRQVQQDEMMEFARETLK